MPVSRGIPGLRRRAKPLTSEEGHRILERDRYCCRYCGLDGLAVFENSLIMTVDFIVPRSRGGKKEAANLVAACRPCNLIKSHHVFKTFEEARTYILNRRAQLRTEWQQKMEKLRGKGAGA
ncbi:MAG: HNH endonuclease [Bryobacteraceae bacterium]